MLLELLVADCLFSDDWGSPSYVPSGTYAKFKLPKDYDDGSGGIYFWPPALSKSSKNN